MTSTASASLWILDQNSEIILGGELTVIDYLLTVRTDQFGGLTYGDTVTVDGVSYKAETQPQRFDDGAFCRVPLVKADPDPAIDYILDGGAAVAAGTIYDGGGA
ncbi:MAG: hypothetical protein EBZ51_12670 [Synechococcaceae bacterium WB9_2_112]|nr:hypothetical protein [Synechococcaceae bacterium WB9_2_112]